MALQNKLFWIERRVSAVFVFITLLEKDPSQNCPEIRGSQHVLGRLVINTLKTPQKVEKKNVLSLKSNQSIKESTCKCDCRKSMMFVSLNSVCVFLVPREWSPVKSMIVRQGHLFVSVTSAPTICAKVIKQKNAHKINGLSQKMGSTITKQKSNNIVHVNITYSKMYIFIYQHNYHKCSPNFLN